MLIVKNSWFFKQARGLAPGMQLEWLFHGVPWGPEPVVYCATLGSIFHKKQDGTSWNPAM